jgi:hypothetical protein
MEEGMDDLSAADVRRHHDNESGEKYRRPARDVALGKCWAFVDHRSMADVIAAERLP